MKINKINTIAIVFYTMMLAYSQYSYATGIQIPITVPCSKDFLSAVNAPWTIYHGIPGIQYVLTTTGLLDSHEEDILMVYKYGFVSKTSNNISVSVEAVCIPRNVSTELSLTGSSIACNPGDGIKIKMYTPNDVDPNRYKYVGKLTLIKEDDEDLGEKDTEGLMMKVNNGIKNGSSILSVKA